MGRGGGVVNAKRTFDSTGRLGPALLLSGEDIGSADAHNVLRVSDALYIYI